MNSLIKNLFDAVEQHLRKHREFLTTYYEYEKDIFIAAGPKVPRDGASYWQKPLKIEIWSLLTRIPAAPPYENALAIDIIKQKKSGNPLPLNDVPKPYENLLARCWSNKPESRPSAEDVLKFVIANPIPSPDYMAQGIQHEKNGQPYLAWNTYKQGAKEGDPNCQTNLGTLLLYGLQAPYDAHQFFKQSAHAGHPRGMLNLGYTHEKGFNKSQTPKLAKAKYWYEKAQEAGDPNAQERLNKLSM